MNGAPRSRPYHHSNINYCARFTGSSLRSCPAKKAYRSGLAGHGLDILYLTRMRARTNRILRKLITRLRARLGDDPDRFIKNARGRGYWLSIRESAAGKT